MECGAVVRFYWLGSSLTSNVRNPKRTSNVLGQARAASCAPPAPRCQASLPNLAFNARSASAKPSASRPAINTVVEAGRVSAETVYAGGLARVAYTSYAYDITLRPPPIR